MILKILVFVLVIGSSAWASTSDLADLYKARYQVRDLFTVHVNNRGNGDERLYGTRNLRVVLHGVLYRGGANNSYHKDNPRSNTSPLQNSALENLCKEGFSGAVYAYKTGFDSANRDIKCDSFRQNNNRFTYHQYNPLSPSQVEPILDLVHRVIINQQGAGPLYIHCWNGWHASGYLAAVALIQFCGMSNEDAYNYWAKTIEGNPLSYKTVIQSLKNFRANPALGISSDVQAKICPKIN